MQTGGGSGGATALARAALESKRGISADIQKQEQSNNEARAEGANQVAQLKASGEAFKFQAQEDRDVAKLNRLQAEQDNANILSQQAQNAKMAANQQMVSAVGGAVGGMFNPANMVSGGKSFNTCLLYTSDAADE